MSDTSTAVPAPSNDSQFSDPVEEESLHVTMARPVAVVQAPLPATDKPTNGQTDKPVQDIHSLAFDYDPHWQGKPLEAFTYARQSLAAMLASQSPGVGSIGTTSEAYMPAVWAVLYLCTHLPEDFRHLRSDPGKFWEAIEHWAEDEGCPRDQWPDAITLIYGSRPTKEDPDAPRILGLWEAARANIVSIRRRNGPPSLTMGNVPRQ
jgi:hypothetical protein